MLIFGMAHEKICNFVPVYVFNNNKCRNMLFKLRVFVQLNGIKLLTGVYVSAFAWRIIFWCFAGLWLEHNNVCRISCKEFRMEIVLCSENWNILQIFIYFFSFVVFFVLLFYFFFQIFFGLVVLDTLLIN